MEDWKQLTRAGNRSYERGDFACARRAYLEALATAERWLVCGEPADEAVAAFVISHQNLAEVYAGLDDCERAIDHLRAAHERLVHLLEDDDRPELQLAALRHCNRARLELMTFARNDGLSMTLAEDTRSRPVPRLVATLH